MNNLIVLYLAHTTKFGFCSDIKDNTNPTQWGPGQAALLERGQPSCEGRQERQNKCTYSVRYSKSAPSH